MSRVEGDSPHAFEAAFARLQIHIEDACLREPSHRWAARVAAGIRAGLEFAAINPAAANRLTNEALASHDGIARYHRMVAYLGERLRDGRAQSRDGDRLPPTLERALVGGVVMLVAQRLAQGNEEDLPALAPEATEFVLIPYLGADEARRVVADAEP